MVSSSEILNWIFSNFYQVPGFFGRKLNVYLCVIFPFLWKVSFDVILVVKMPCGGARGGDQVYLSHTLSTITIWQFDHLCTVTIQYWWYSPTIWGHSQSNADNNLALFEHSYNYNYTLELSGIWQTSVTIFVTNDSKQHWRKLFQDSVNHLRRNAKWICNRRYQIHHHRYQIHHPKYYTNHAKC